MKKIFLFLAILCLHAFGAQWTKLQTATSSSTTVTLDPTTKGSAATLSNGNLRYISGATAGNDAAYSTAKGVGKLYCEIKIVSTDANSGTSFGVSGTNTYQANFPYKSADAWVYMGHGYVMNNNAFLTAVSGSAFTIANNDIISISLDTISGTVSFRKNGGAQWTFNTTASGKYLVVAGDGNEIYDINFGATPFVYAPPSGYTGWNQ